MHKAKAIEQVFEEAHLALVKLDRHVPCAIAETPSGQRLFIATNGNKKEVRKRARRKRIEAEAALG